MNMELVEKPRVPSIMPFFNPVPEPNSSTSIRIPQKTPKHVRRLLVLLRVMVTHISCHLSKSNIFSFVVYIIYSALIASIAVIFTAFCAGKYPARTPAKMSIPVDTSEIVRLTVGSLNIEISSCPAASPMPDACIP